MERVNKLCAHLSANPTSASTDDMQKRLAAIESETNTITYEVADGGVAVLTLNRPSRGNALTNSMQAEYFNLLERAEADPAVKVVVVTGAGRMFCVGMDMEALATIGVKTAGGKSASAALEKLSRNVEQIQAFKLSKPVIAAVNGSTAGLGMVMALSADIRFSTTRAKWTTAFAKRGLVAEHGSSWILPKIVGVSTALDLLLSSRVVQGAEAKEIGLVSQVFESQEALMNGTLQYARDMARLCSPASMAAMKAQVYEHYNQGVEEAYGNSTKLMKNSFKHPDSKEGVKSYIEQRDPVFEGLQAGQLKDL